MKIWKITLLGLIVVSCSGEATTVRKVENNSGKTITMVIYRDGVRYTDTLYLETGEEAQISVISYDQAEEEEDDCVRGLDSAYYEIEGGGIVTKDISRQSSWDVLTERTKTSPPEYEHECVFEILSTDIDE